MKKCKALIALLVLLVCGCGKKEMIEISELSSTLAESVSFSEQLTEIDASNIEKRYALNSKDYTEITAFVGTLSTCDEYVIVKTENPEAITEKFNKYIEKKREEYKVYRPDEVYKLDSAVIETHNKSVVMIITADSENAIDVYKKYLKK